MVKKSFDPGPSLASFYRKGRKCFVPLTAEEVSRAEVSIFDLTQLGFAEWYQQGGVSCYRLTSAGKKAFLDQREGMA
jgi:hypothetical protein